MEAKDTVMTPQEIQDNTYAAKETREKAEEYYGDTVAFFDPIDLACRIQLAQVQAEISFKAGVASENGRIAYMLWPKYFEDWDTVKEILVE